MTEITTQDKPEFVRIQGTPFDCLKQAIAAAEDGYVLSVKNKHFPVCIMPNVWYLEMILPDEITIVEEVVEPVKKEPSPEQAALLESIQEQVGDLSEQVGAAEIPVVPQVKRAGRPSRK